MNPPSEPARPAEESDGATPLPTGLSFEQARDQLTEVVERLQAGTESLAESLDLWERGERLAKVCEGFLEAAKERVQRVVSETRGETPAQ